MIKRLRVKHFKSWADTNDLRLAPLTAFFGANSSGKTSLLQALLLLKQTVLSLDERQILKLGGETAFVNLGSFHDVVHQHNLEVPITLQLGWQHGMPDDAQLTEPLSFLLEVSQQQGKLYLNRFEYQLSEKTFTVFSERSPQGIRYKIAQKTPNHTAFLPSPHNLSDTINAFRFPSFLQVTQSPDIDIKKMLALPYHLSRQLNDLKYLGPLRAVPQHTYIWAGDTPSDVGKSGERTIPALLSARTDGNHEVEHAVAYWLKEMNLIHAFALEPMGEEEQRYTLRVQKTAHSAHVNIMHVGFGISQILPVLVLCYYVPEGTTLILEQPEIHLHPSIQAALVDVFIDVIQKRNLQIIIESHSEYFVNRLQRRIAEEALPYEKTALYFCKMTEASSVIDPLQLDRYGNITNWPDDFFGDAMGDIIARTEAQIARQMS